MQATSVNGPAETTPSAATAAPPGNSSHPADVARDLYAVGFTLNQRASRDLFQTLADMGLSITQFKMLHLLVRADGDQASVKALGDQFQLSLAAASRAVDGLHQRGYVEREECETDRRVKRVRITERGREAVRECHRTNISLLAEYTATLTETQRRNLSDALAPLLAQLDVRPSTEGPTT